MTGSEWVQRLLNPGKEWTAFPFWFLNGDLDPEEIRRQVRDFHAHGVDGFVLHPRMGISPEIEYLSETFFERLGAAIEEASRLGMKVVLYDEGMYPSGSACGQVVRLRPDLKSRGIALTEQPEKDDTVLCACGGKMLVERFSGGTIRGIHFGEDDGEEHAPPSADILCEDAVNLFVQLTHEQYWQHFHEEFGKTIIGFFTDEPSILGRNTRDLMPWSRDFARLFTEKGGHLEGLAALFEGGENADTALYHRLILEREETVYYASLSRWCEAHGIFLMGHPHQSDDMEVEKYFHVPGQDLVLRWLAPETGDLRGMDSVMGKCSADAAWVFGRERNSNECFGACNRDGNPWYETGGDLKWYLDYLAVRGVNLFIPHAFYYSLEGARSQERPPDVGPGSIWWPHYEKWSRYMKALSFLMTNAKVHADIAVLCRNRALNPEGVEILFRTQRGFRYLPESVWPEIREENGALVLRGQKFHAVIGTDRYPGVSHDPMSICPDLKCDSAQPDLRVMRFVHENVDTLFMVNTGEETLDFLACPGGDGPWTMVDLWTGRAWKAQTDAEGRVRICLPRRGSLVLAACDAGTCPETPAGKMQVGWTLQEEDRENFRKIYTAELESDGDGDALVEVQAEEMAELYVNDAYLDASFWPPHSFRIPAGMLKRGRNTLRLVVTGSPANRYGRPVPYGLTE